MLLSVYNNYVFDDVILPQKNIYICDDVTERLQGYSLYKIPKRNNGIKVVNGGVLFLDSIICRVQYVELMICVILSSNLTE